MNMIDVPDRVSSKPHFLLLKFHLRGSGNLFDSGLMLLRGSQGCHAAGVVFGHSDFIVDNVLLL